MAVTRITIGGDKKDALLAARRIRNHLEDLGRGSVRGEYVRLDGRLYLDVHDGADLTNADLAEFLRDTATLEIVSIDTPTAVDECLNCGNIADSISAVCPNCSFREISSCPSCGNDVPRTEYVPGGGTVFQCPRCRTRVRLAYNEPIWREDGHYNEPVVIVTRAARGGR